MSFDHLLTHNGLTLTVAEWSRRTGLKDKTIYMRIKAGWTVERALERPLQAVLMVEEKRKKDPKAVRRAREEREQIRAWLRTQPADIDERREEGDIL